MTYPLFFCPSIEGGGVEKNLYLISYYLVKQNQKVHIITANKNMKKHFNKNVIFICPNSNKWSFSNRIIKIFICALLFIKIKKNFLIISFQANVFAIILAKLFNLKVIVRANTAPEKFVNSFFKKLIFMFFFKMADCVIVNSIDFKKSLKKYLGINSKVIYNPIKKKKYKNKNIFKKNLNIINVGRLTEQKNHIFLLKTLSKLDKKFKWTLKIVGKGNLKKKIKLFIKKNYLSKKVKLVGYKSNAIYEISKSDLFILSSIYEGLPNVLIEAQQTGTPIISTDCRTGPREILMNGKLGELVKINNETQLLNKIRKFYINKKNLYNKASLAKKYLYRFDYKNNCESYKNLIGKFT